jgi:hypothetical protein
MEYLIYFRQKSNLKETYNTPSPARATAIKILEKFFIAGGDINNKTARIFRLSILL